MPINGSVLELTFPKLILIKQYFITPVTGYVTLGLLPIRA